VPLPQPEPKEGTPQENQQPIYRGYQAHFDSTPHEGGVTPPTASTAWAAMEIPTTVP